MLPEIISSYTNIIQRNFGILAPFFSMHRHIHSRIIVEISEQSTEFIETDHLLLSYILLPSAPTGLPVIRFIERQNSLAENFIINSRSLGSIYSDDVNLITELDGKAFREHHAIISRTICPNRHVITSQVYQLVLNEARQVFGDSFEWSKSIASEADRNKIALEIAQRNLR